MQDGRRGQGDTSTLEVDDVLTVDLPDDGMVDRDYLREVFREPDKYLTPRRTRARFEPPETAPESRLARRAKVAGLVTAVTALIASVIAAAALAEQPSRAQGIDQLPRRTVSDIEALGALNGKTSEGQATRKAAPPVATSTSRPATIVTTTEPKETQRTGKGAAATSTRSAPETTTTSRSPAGSTSERVAGSERPTTRSTSKLDAVREFYRLVPDSPADALGMLDQAVLGNRLGDLLAAWQSLDDVRLLDVHERADGSVHAVVTMLRPNGERIRVAQLFRFADGTLIDHVQLLSAQHI